MIYKDEKFCLSSDKNHIWFSYNDFLNEYSLEEIYEIGKKYSLYTNIFYHKFVFIGNENKINEAFDNLKNWIENYKYFY